MYSRIKEVNELNELRIRRAKEEHEKELINPHHEQCQMVPASIDNTTHGMVFISTLAISCLQEYWQEKVQKKC